MLAIVFALDKWHQFAYGRHVLVNTDHKPLKSIAKKPLDRVPKRLQGMLHVHHLADMMSGSFIPANNQGTSNKFEVINAVQFLPNVTREDTKTPTRDLKG